MSYTHSSHNTTHRDLAGSQRGSRSRKQTRLRHRHSGQSGWTVYLDADGNGQLGTGEISATTAGDGSYGFNGLTAGTYSVTEVPKLGWQQTYPAGTAPAIERVSLAADGTQGNGSVDGGSALSADGRYVAFSTVASNLVAGDTNGVSDIFVYDRQTDIVERVSLASNGTQGNGWSTVPTISAEGQYVAFASTASNLVDGDTNGMKDVFVVDHETGTIERVSLASNGMEGNGSSGTPSLSDDGRYVAFSSAASNLVDGDTNGVTDTFVVDRQTHTIERVSLAADGTQGNGWSSSASISADGLYVVFYSVASNLVDGDTNGVTDTFVYGRQTHTIERVSLAADGTQGNSGVSGGLSISADGRYVAFSSAASNLVPGDTNGVGDIFVYDRQTDIVERVSLASNGTQGSSNSFSPSLSADGRYVAFTSNAYNLVPGDTSLTDDVFVYDRQTDTIERVSLAVDGTQGDNGSAYPKISADGRYVAFYSGASTFVPGDTNGVADTFVTANPFARVLWSRSVVLADDQNVSGISIGNAALTTKFYVVNDATQNLTYEYSTVGQLNESYSLNSGNTAPRGAASTIAGTKTWVIDANRKVYVYNTSGGLLGSWTAGTLATTATVEGITTNGTDVWIVDAKSDKVYKYAGAASRLSGSQTATSSFSLNSANTNPKDLVTDGVNMWVVNDSGDDKVFKYTTTGTLLGSWGFWTGSFSPTGITIDPANVSDIWIVDSWTKRVSRYTGAANSTSGLRTASASFALAPGNTNPQGIADPPAPGLELSAAPVAAAPALVATACDTHAPIRPSLGSHTVTRTSGAERVTTVLRGVDVIMNSWGNATEPIQHRTHTARTTGVPTRRHAHNVDFELLGNELETTIGLCAEDWAMRKLS